MANHLDLEEQEQLDQLKHFWNTWGTLISSVLVAVALALVAWNGYRYWQKKQALQAAALYDAVELAVMAGDEARLGQAFVDLRSLYPDTNQAAQAGLLVSKVYADKGSMTAAKSALSWTAEYGADEGYKVLARLRLSGILMAEKSHDDALKQLAGPFPAEYSALVADRKGDAFRTQGKNQEAIAEYSRAFKELPDAAEYRRLVEVKLNALGWKSSPPVVAVASEVAK
jgi:predicted negative regulator of RcsB-dependent stress response